MHDHTLLSKTMQVKTKTKTNTRKRQDQEEDKAWHDWKKIGRITHNNGHFAFRGHSRSPILVPIKSSYTAIYEALWADIGRNFAVLKGVGHFKRKFKGERGVPTNDFWHQKSRVPGLSYGEKKLPKSSNA